MYFGDVGRRGGDFAEHVGGMNAQIGHAGRVGGDQREEIARQGKLITPFAKMLPNLVEWMVPKFRQEFLGCFVVASEADAIGDVLGLDLDDAAGERVESPCQQGLVDELAPVVVVAVAVDGIPINALGDVGLCHRRGGKFCMRAACRSERSPLSKVAQAMILFSYALHHVLKMSFHDGMIV